MTALNRTGSRIAVELELLGATDVTDFGLLGHAWEMAGASGVGMHIHLRDVPLMEGARACAGQRLFPGGSYYNRDYYSPNVRFTDDISEEDRMLLLDAQTSGGLLLAVPPDKPDRLVDRLAADGQPG